eukprot:645085-Rhodomonas_salina.1
MTDADIAHGAATKGPAWDDNVYHIRGDHHDGVLEGTPDLHDRQQPHVQTTSSAQSTVPIAQSLPVLVSSAICPRNCYAMSVTDVAYGGPGSGSQLRLQRRINGLRTESTPKRLSA